MQQYDLIVFDWDGTLMDSTQLIVDSIRQASMDIGLAPPAIEDAKYIIGLGLQDSMQHLFPSLPQQQRQDIALAYRKHFIARDHETPLFPGIHKMLTELRGRHGFLAVATGKSRAGLERALTHSGLKPFFDFSRCADEGFAKPHPDMLHKLMELSGVEPARALMVGDTTHDLLLASNAGIQALAVCYGAHERKALQNYPALAYLSSVEALHSWLNQNG